MNEYIRTVFQHHDVILVAPCVAEDISELIYGLSLKKWQTVDQGWLVERGHFQGLVFSAAYIRAMLEKRPDLKSAQLFFEMSGGAE